MRYAEGMAGLPAENPYVIMVGCGTKTIGRGIPLKAQIRLVSTNGPDETFVCPNQQPQKTKIP